MLKLSIILSISRTPSPKFALKLRLENNKPSGYATHAAFLVTLLDLCSLYQNKNSNFESLLSKVSAHPSPHRFDNHNNKRLKNNLFVWENNMWCYAVCLQKGCHFLPSCEALPAFSLSPTSLALLVHPENERGTQFNSITVFFSSSSAVSFPPLCLPHSNFSVVVRCLSSFLLLSIHLLAGSWRSVELK